MKRPYSHVLEIGDRFVSIIVTPEPVKAWNHARKAHGVHGERIGPRTVNKGWEWYDSNFEQVKIHAVPTYKFGDDMPETAYVITVGDCVEDIVLTDDYSVAKGIADERYWNGEPERFDGDYETDDGLAIHIWSAEVVVPDQQPVEA